MGHHRVCLGLGVSAALLAFSPAASALDFVIVGADGAGEGLNDTTAATPVGGNAGTTRGAQRRNVIAAALSQWGAVLGGEVTLEVQASFDPLPCSTNSGVLGVGGSTFLFFDFPGAPRDNTWYPSPLANQLAGTDLAPGVEMTVTLNSALTGSAGCLGGDRFYLGLDGNPPSNTIDLLTVVLHEVGHALGFVSSVDVETGERLDDRDDAFMLFLRDKSTNRAWVNMTDAQRRASAIDSGDLYWTGSTVVAAASGLTMGRDAATGFVKMYAPNPVEPGSSVSHVDTTVTPNEVMEPVVDGVVHDLGITLAFLLDMGWPSGLCGNGAIDPGETCDDGNTVANDCCAPTCEREPAGTSCGSAPANACDVQDTCSAAGVCVARFATAGTTCGDATNTTCNGRDTCNGAGTCVANLATAGTTCGDATNTTCNGRDTCDGLGACVANLAARGTTCGDATNTTCNRRDTCDGRGACQSNLVATGTPCGDQTTAACDDANTCNGMGACLDNRKPTGTVCRAAANVCDVEERCDGVAVGCPTNAFAPNGTSCADARVCNGTETCSMGVCQRGTALSCDDGSACTQDACMEPMGCASTPIAGCCLSAAACDDGDACTLDDCPVVGGACTHTLIPGCCATRADCDDRDLCTADACIPGSPAGTCASSPITGCCEANSDCSDDVACTSDACDLDTHRCVFTALPSCCSVDGDCEDENVCTTDRCSAGLCERTAVAGCCVTDGDCDDQDDCTLDTCAGDHRCGHEPIDGCVPDGGVADTDAGSDAGPEGDGGPADARSDASSPDAAPADATTSRPDAGRGGEPPAPEGCACRTEASGEGEAFGAWTAVVGLVLMRAARRRRR